MNKIYVLICPPEHTSMILPCINRDEAVFPRWVLLWKGAIVIQSTYPMEKIQGLLHEHFHEAIFVLHEFDPTQARGWLYSNVWDAIYSISEPNGEASSAPLFVNTGAEHNP